MKIKMIACKVMMRQLYALAAVSQNAVEIRWMRQQLHETPEEMRRWLQRSIDDIESEDDEFDAICLAYGLCSNGTVGITVTKKPLIIPRAHDCITLLLGSRERYAKLFEAGNGGIYWYSQGWIEAGKMPGRKRHEALYREYVEKYGEDNADYLLELEQGWMREYSKATYIRWPNDLPGDEAFTRDSAEFFRWEFEAVQGDPALMKDLLDGNWDEKRFLTVNPGQSVAAAYDGGIIQAV